MAKNTTKKTTKNTKDNSDSGQLKQSHEFQAEVAKLLHLMVHSVYSEQEVFLRELISNASDACDKLRYQALQNPKLLDGEADLHITITPDAKAKTLTITDNGIGMDEAELIGNLGTIARSGTQAFMEQVKDSDNANNLIGQFGIGFYSAFIVADRVDVISRKAGENLAYKWSSDGSGGFDISPVADGDAPQRGSQITLHLRKDAKEFLETGRLEHIVRTYSDHVSHPIMLRDGDDLRQINTASAIWMRAKKDITAEQYKEFFTHVSGCFGDPALTLHYKAEGRNEYNVLLYVPELQPYDLFDQSRRGRQKLYVRRVFITEDAELLPGYLRFVRGVIDSEDMPLNISREMLQDNPTVATIRKAVTKRVLNELKKTAEKKPEIYEKIWQTFGPVIKEGLYEDGERRDALLEIVRFRTTSSGDDLVSLKDYLGRMQENQTAIYYLAADDARDLAASPQLEGYQARNIEVLLLSDPVDSFWVRQALGYDGKPFKSVTQGTADLDAIALSDREEKPEENDATNAGVIAAIKTTLGDKVQDVRASKRLTKSPACLVAQEGGLDRNLEKILSKQQAAEAGVSAPILEINTGHPLIKMLGEKLGAKADDSFLQDVAGLLLDQAYIQEGEPVSDAHDFSRRLTDILGKALAG